MSVAASVVLATARTFLNDDGGLLWTDAVLIPKLQEAHRELQSILRYSSAPVMRKVLDNVTVNAAVTVFPSLPSDLIEPIKLWEKAPADPTTAYVPMTSADPLPRLAQGTTLGFYQWLDEAINFVGSSANRVVRMLYWRSLVVPTAAGDAIGFLQGELYLGPKTAAIAAGAIGERATFDWLDDQASRYLNMVILANKGKLKPMDGTVLRP